MKKEKLKKKVNTLSEDKMMDEIKLHLINVLSDENTKIRGFSCTKDHQNHCLYGNVIFSLVGVNYTINIDNYI